MTSKPSTPENNRATLQVLTRFAEKLSAGRPVCRSLREIQEELADQPIAKVVTSVLKDIEGGATVGEAFAKHPTVFSASVVTLISAGEKTGILDHMLVLILECAWRYPGRLL